MSKVAGFGQATAHAQGLLEFLESNVADATLVQVDSLQTTSSITLFLDHAGDSLGALVANLITFETEIDQTRRTAALG